MREVSQQLDAIHTMLSAGQRNLRIERHTLILWGLVGGVISLISDNILTPEQFPDNTQRALAWLLFLGIIFGSVAILDWQLTRRAKQIRDESWSFIHRQILKVFWLLTAAGILFTFATFFFGGDYMIFGAWIILLGLGLYIHGLFSEEMLEWAGALMMLIGITSIAAQLPYQTTQWIAASTFGIGLPLLGMMLDQGRTLPAWKRLSQSTLWVIAVLALPLLAHRYPAKNTPPDAPTISLASYRQLGDVTGLHVVSIPAGTEIPVQFEMSGNVFDHTSSPTLSLKTATPVELVLRDGKLTGDTRPSGESWLPKESLIVHIPWIKAELTPELGAVVRSSLLVDFKNKTSP
jgi:hypothetical protein